MIKADLVNRVAEESEIPRGRAALAVDAIFTTMKDALRCGKRIELRGFGTFQISERRKGLARNPHTGVEVTIAPGMAVRFKPGKELREL
ncbi:MAG: integration host factor subunit beta [bacterium]|nr:integration host factor subunit beta [bacterium]